MFIYLTNTVTQPPVINPNVQDVLDSYHSFFLLQNRLCNWNPFSSSGTLVNVFGAIEELCSESSLCTITKTDHDAEIIKSPNIDIKRLSFVCFPFIRGITMIQGMYDGTEDDRVYKKIINTNEKSLWEILLETGIKMWAEKWEESKRSKRHLSDHNSDDNASDDSTPSEVLYTQLKERIWSELHMDKYSNHHIGPHNSSIRLYFVFNYCIIFILLISFLSLL